MKGFLGQILKYILIIVVWFFISFIIGGYIETGTFALDPMYLMSSNTLAVFGVGMLAYLIYVLYKKMDEKGGSKKGKLKSSTGKDVAGKEMAQYYDSDWVTERMLKSDPAYNYCTNHTISNLKKDGILVRAEKEGGILHINWIDPIHTLIIGTTGSGKTTQYLEPTIQLLAKLKTKPSMVISDPKGELFEHHAVMLKDNGYDVRVLDLRKPFASTKWNPMSNAYKTYHRSFVLEKEIKKHSLGDNPKNHGLIKQMDFDDSIGEWYEFDGNAYTNRDLMMHDVEVRKKEMQDKAYNELGEIAATLAPVEDTKNPSWEKTAQSFIHGVMVAMLEDSMDPRLGMTEKKYNPYNLAKIINYTDTGRDPYATLKKYFDNRDKFSKAPNLVNTALNNADVTTKNYMGFASAKMQLFNDTGICYLTSETEMDLSGVDDRPTVFFLKIPDELIIRHPLATLFVSQLYKRLVEEANNQGGKLKRNVYFLLDEFGNLPRFPEFGASMAVGRSRGIFFELVIQSYSQLNKKYGEEEAKVIRDNCPNQVYIGTDDIVTNKEFSELLGNRTVELTNVSVSKGGDSKENKTESKSSVSRPLVYPHELTSFMKDEILIIKTFKRGAIKAKFTPWYKATNLYDIRKEPPTFTKLQPLDEDALYYDISKRNEIVRSSSGSDDDDFDFFK